MNFNNVGFYSREIALLFPRMVLPLSSLVVVCFAHVFATRFNSDAAASSTSFAIQRLVPLLLAVTRKLIFGQCKNASRINRGRNYCVSLRAKTRYNGLLCVWTEARRGSTMGRRSVLRPRFGFRENWIIWNWREFWKINWREEEPSFRQFKIII